MKRAYGTVILIIAAAAIFCVFCIASGQGVQNNPASQRLPGARAVIEAGRYATIQAALDALPDEGGVVRLPPGTFEISEPLKVTKPDVLIEGAGTATHIKNINTEGKSALILQHPGGGDNRKAELWRIRLANFRITGNEKSGHGIEARRINEIFIDGVTVSYHGGDGIQLYYCYEDPRICDSLMTYNKKTGLNVIGCHDVVVSANQFEENHDAVWFIDGFNLCMTGNNLDDHLGHGVVIENTYGSVVSGNMIEECAGTAIVLDRDCYGIALSANVIAHNSSGGIDLRDAHGCTVSANTFTISGPDAMSIGPNSGRITVTGNNFSNSYLGDGKVMRGTNDLVAAGMVLTGTSNVTVVGNLFSSVRPKALRVEGQTSESVLFADNVLVDVDSDHGKLDKSLVRDNLESAK
ncbi:MAG TPA: right-handed parallel beta-helix repeat-containing protein [Sedimentisphaerales bacterium]|nr:right-handed parallel beta-helix repeat-containing protein [Sedimentisphaerales bacterium]